MVKKFVTQDCVCPCRGTTFRVFKNRFSFLNFFFLHSKVSALFWANTASHQSEDLCGDKALGADFCLVWTCTFRMEDGSGSACLNRCVSANTLNHSSWCGQYTWLQQALHINSVPTCQQHFLPWTDSKFFNNFRGQLANTSSPIETEGKTATDQVSRGQTPNYFRINKKKPVRLEK